MTASPNQQMPDQNRAYAYVLVAIITTIGLIIRYA